MILLKAYRMSLLCVLTIGSCSEFLWVVMEKRFIDDLWCQNVCSVHVCFFLKIQIHHEPQGKKRKGKKKDALQARNEIQFNPIINSDPDLNSPHCPRVQVWNLIWPVTNKNESHETLFWIQNSLQFFGRPLLSVGERWALVRMLLNPSCSEGLN